MYSVHVIDGNMYMYLYFRGICTCTVLQCVIQNKQISHHGKQFELNLWDELMQLLISLLIGR